MSGTKENKVISSPLNLTSGTNLTQFLNSKNPGHLHLYDKTETSSFPSPLNIIYFGNESINKAFVQASEQYIRPTKFSFLGKTIISSLAQKDSIINTKPDPLITGRIQPILKKAQNKPIVFDISSIYHNFIMAFNSLPKNKVKEGIETLINSIIKDFTIKAPNRKNILIIDEQNIKISTSAQVDSILSFIRYMVVFKLHFNIVGLDAVIFFNSKNNLFYPLTLPTIGNNVNLNTLTFNNQMVIHLIKDINPKQIDSLLEPIDIHLNPKAREEQIISINQNLDADKKEINDLLNSMEKLDEVIQKSSDSEITKSTTQEKEKIIQQIKDISNKYPGEDIQAKLKYIFSTELDNKVIAETKAKPLTQTQTEQHQVLDTIERINQVYNGAVLFKDIEPNLTKQVFQPSSMVGLEEISSINKQKTEMFEKMDENIRDLTEAFTQDPDIKIKVLDIKSKLVETNKDRFIEYSVKIQHDYGIATKKPYNIIFRVPAPIDDKYIKVGGNNYIMIQQLFPQPIQKVSNTVARLYTHYNTTSVILKGSTLETKDFKIIEKEFIDGLVSSRLLTRSHIEEVDSKTKEKLLEYGCPLSVADLQYNFAF